jgi:hypothetical protein
LQLLLASALSPEQRELADTILESGNTLLLILGDILDFSKINHNSLVLERSPLELRDAVEASIELVAAEAGRKGLEVAYGLQGEELVGRRIMGDSVRIRQVGAGWGEERVLVARPAALNCGRVGFINALLACLLLLLLRLTHTSSRPLLNCCRCR